MVLLLLSKAVAATFLVIAAMDCVWPMPHPEVIRERHIIHAPIKFRVIHHYKIKKVPIVIRKHLHYHKPREEIHQHSLHLLEEHGGNEIHQNNNEYNEYEYNEKDEYPKFKNSDASFHPSNHDEGEDDYEEPEESQEEEEYEEYENK